MGSSGAAENLRVAGRINHRPAVIALLALSGGIIFDRYSAFGPWTWIVAAIITLGITLFASRRHLPTAASLFLLLTLFALGAERHALAWKVRAPDDVAALCTPEGIPVRMIGTIASTIDIHEARVDPGIPSWLEVDRSICTLDCEEIEAVPQTLAVTGRVRLEVSGHLVHAGIGDRVEVLGRLQSPGAPRNPGGLDYRVLLQAQGMSGLLRVDHPLAVTKLNSRSGLRWSLARFRASARDRCQALFAANLRPTARALGASLLLGDRTTLTDEIQDQFAETGTMHLLAISGLHVGILLGLVLILCRLANLSNAWTAAILLTAVGVYAFITDHRPPVLRAGLLAAIAIVGTLRGSRVNSWNSLAVCAMVLLLWHPMDLFDIGAQLSFLAVGAILWSDDAARLLGSVELPEPTPVPEAHPILAWLHPVIHGMSQTYFMTIIVWLATLPLTMAIFHLATPVGMVLNVILIPYIALVLTLGYLFLIGGLLIPSMAGMLAQPFSWSLSLLLIAVRWGQQVPWGHLSVPQIPLWWLIGFYICLGLVWGIVRIGSNLRWPVALLMTWTILGLLLPFVPHHQVGLRCTFLSVGHGLACVVELPGGEVLLYDAGNIGDGARAERAVADYLRWRGRTGIDAALISHADHDHFSGLHGLLESFPPRSILAASSFLDFQQRTIQSLCETAVAQGSRLRIVQAGDQLLPGSDGGTEISLEVLHPRGNRQCKTDNANSVVLLISYAGRRILLTGDLELDGLQQVLEQSPVKANVILAPHHGGKAANVPQLYRWAQPEYVVVSSSESKLPHLEDVVRPARLLNTATSGAITVEIAPDGAIEVKEFLMPMATVSD